LLETFASRNVPYLALPHEIETSLFISYQ